MILTKTQKIIIIFIFIIILFGLYAVFIGKIFVKKNEPTNESTITTTNGVMTSNTSIGEVEASGNYKIEQVSTTDGSGVPQPVPDLNRKITVSSGAKISPEATTMATEKILSLQAQLKKNANDSRSWLNLGIYQKMAGDYEGAVLSWKYVGKLASSDYVSLANLGNLYAYYMHDGIQAENYYKQAILKGPTQPYIYTQFAEVYRDVLKDINKARAIIDQGLSKIPNDPNLLQMKASLN